MTNEITYTAGDRTPYTYLIGWSEHNKWYYGCRFGKYCHPSDLWIKYFTSSTGRNSVEEFRELYGEPDVIVIRKTFDNIRKCQLWEKRVLKTLYVTKRDDFLNRSDGGTLVDNRGKNNGMYGKEVPTHRRDAFIAMAKRPKTTTHKNKISSSRKIMLALPENKHMIEDFVKRISDVPNGMSGKRHSDTTKNAMSESKKELRKEYAYARSIETGENLGYIKKTDERWKTGAIVGLFSGLVAAKDSKTGIYVDRVSKQDPRWLSGELVGINKKI